MTFTAILIGCCSVGGLNLLISQQHHQRIEAAVTRLAGPTEQLEVYGRIHSAVILAPGRVYLDLATDHLQSAGGGIVLQSRVRLTLWLKDRADRERYQQLNLVTGCWLRAIITPQQKQRYRNPGSGNGDWLYTKGFDWAATIKDPTAIEVLQPAEKRSLTGYLDLLRNYLYQRIDNRFEPGVAGVIKAAILGNGYYLNPEITEDFQVAGIFHVLVISGSHVALLAGISSWLLGFCCSNRAIRILLTILVLWSYGLLVGADLPIMRAVLMATVVLIALLLDRYSQPVNSLGLAAFLLLGYCPLALFDPGFQLTFLAVTMILLIAMPLAKHLADIGGWRLSARTPYPPRCRRFLRRLAEILYWQEIKFQQDRRDAPIRYRLDKAAMAGYLERFYLQRPLRAITILLVTSVIVQAGLLPLSAYYFHRITLIGIPLTIIADLLMFLLLITFLLFILLDFCLPGLGSSLAVVVTRISELFISLAALAEPNSHDSYWHLLSFRVASYDGRLFPLYVIYYLPILFFIIKLNNWQPLTKPELTRTASARWRRWSVLTFIICYLVLLLVVTIPQSVYSLQRHYRARQLEITFLDVGQGDAALVVFPGGTTMLIDSGGSWRLDESTSRSAGSFSAVGLDVDARFLWSQGIEHLDYIVATHTHLDHIEGFRALIKHFSIGQAIVPAIPGQDVEFNNFAQQLSKADVPLRVWSQSQRFTIEGVTIDVLWSGPAHPNRLDNNQSLVLRLSYGNQSVLMTGDIEAPVEQQLLDAGVSLTSQILKVPHHGSKTSSSPEFIAKIKPQIAIISAPIRSRFHHPNRDVIARYRALQTELYQTGYHGAVKLVLDGEKLQVECFAGCDQELPDRWDKR